MPMHDWSRVDPGTYHNFHLLWIAALTQRLNAGLLPPDCFAMAEQFVGGSAPDVVTLHLADDAPSLAGGGLATLDRPQTRPHAAVVMEAESDVYAEKANRIVIKHRLGRVLAVIELVSPGNKSSRHALRALVEKLANLLRERVNLLVIDPFPPSPRDPQGLHALLWNEVADQSFVLPDDRPLTIAAYQAEPIKTAYIEPTAVGLPLPTMPLFLAGESYILLPLEESYHATWASLPPPLRAAIAPTSA